MLVDDTEGCARAMLELLADTELAAERARAGREHVREHFLLPRLLTEELRLLATLERSSPAPPAGAGVGS
jgi:trehalose synthase